MSVIGITGTIGSGKDVAANIFCEWGFNLINVDEMGHLVLSEKKDFLITIFGDKILKDGVIDRKKLGEIVFKNHHQLERLEQVLHPAMVEKVIRIIEDNSEQDFVINAALLYQMGLAMQCDKIIFIEVSEKVALERIEKRGNMSLKIAKKVIKKQKNIKQIKKFTDKVVINESSLEDLQIELAETLNAFFGRKIDVQRTETKHKKGNVYPELG